MEKIDRKAILVHIISKENKELREEYLEEFRLLVETLSYEIVAETTYSLREPRYSTFLGTGKIEELKKLAQLTDAKIVFIDTTLTFLQLRNLSKELGVPVVDRPHLILMIFSMRARTTEAKLQVELSQLKMRLPEIVHEDVDLDQQTGSEMGLKGPGERKTELKRRYIAKRIQILEKKLEEIKKHRVEIRKRRTKSSIPIISIVGYTNAGKSTLLNTLTQSEAYVEDKLFATLDSLSRVGEIKQNISAIFVDTIGFIRDLPPQLIYAFHSTLEEILDSWIIIHLVDASDPLFRDKMEVVLCTLKDLGASNIPIITVFNKIDKIGEEPLKYLQSIYKDAIFISAKESIGIDQLKERLANMLSELIVRVKIVLPYKDAHLLDEIYTVANVISRKDTEENIILYVEGYYSNLGKFKNYFSSQRTA
ncbi:GTPase HflX [Caldisericum exile]|uniref:GTPase HflX n=1 Tax=Caldisericum exile (strain DSM 21853 / NBRC 104410 / AZM16c01) TaxID=511051 RepID=A0A7U6GEF3_CALEA|nr:GTPase HflX [Caldisericum exile]BAL80860.1 putative GTP-binding protein HflX [Caldisericum exile AZM16c01]